MYVDLLSLGSTLGRYRVVPMDKEISNDACCLYVHTFYNPTCMFVQIVTYTAVSGDGSALKEQP